MNDKKVEYIQYYKTSIENSKNDPERILHCLKKLETIRVNVQHLQDIGIGRTVNAVRGFDGEVGEMAQKLVNKWKSLVAESEPINSKTSDEELPEKIEESKSSHRSKPPSSSSREKEKENGKKSRHHTSSSSSSHPQSHHSSSSKEHKEKKSSSDGKSSESKHKSSNHTSSSTASSHHKTSRDHESSSSSSKKRSHDEASLMDAKENETKAKRLKTESLTSEKSDIKKSSSSGSGKGNESKEQSTSSSVKSSKSKDRKHSSKRTSSKDDELMQQEFDGSTGNIGFAEALMMFDMPSSSKSKKQLADKIVTVKSSTTGGGGGSSSSNHISKSSSSKDYKNKSSSSSSSTAAVPSISSSNTPASSASNSRPSTSTAAASSSAEQKSLQTLTQPPKLLTQKPKLDLLPDIVSDIVIPDYRPLPLTASMKDYIDSNFGSFDSAGGSRQMPKMDDGVQFSSSKANRTKVYSGNSKTRSEIPKLFDMCIRILQENIDFLECTGGVPFEILKPVLERAKPDQLSVIEYYNPYLLDESDILWKPHCQRKWKNKQPGEMETWREMYERCTREEEEKLSRLTQNIKQQQEISSNGVQKTKMAYVDSFVKPPRGIVRKQEQFGTNRKLVASPAARVDALRHLAPNIVSGRQGDVRLRVAAGLRDDAQQSVGRGNMQRAMGKKAPLMAKILQKFKR